MRIKVKPIWRRPYEISAVVAWLTAAGIMYYAGLQSGNLAIYPFSVASLCGFFAIIRATQIFILWERKARLIHLPDYEMDRDAILKILKRAEKRAARGKLRIDE